MPSSSRSSKRRAETSPWRCASYARRAWLDVVGDSVARGGQGSHRGPGPDAYEKLIDGLLGSEHYGERQARRWLDLARYADTTGDSDDGSGRACGVRDDVIRASTQDRPDTSSIREELAGDEIGDTQRGDRDRHGFLRSYPDCADEHRDLVLEASPSKHHRHDVLRGHGASRRQRLGARVPPDPQVRPGIEAASSLAAGISRLFCAQRRDPAAERAVATRAEDQRRILQSGFMPTAPGRAAIAEDVKSFDLYKSPEARHAERFDEDLVRVRWRSRRATGARSIAGSTTAWTSPPRRATTTISSTTSTTRPWRTRRLQERGRHRPGRPEHQ